MPVDMIMVTDNDNISRFKSKYSEATFLALGQAATAGAMLLLISTAPNLIAKSTVEEFVHGRTISFTDWFIIGSPHAVRSPSFLDSRFLNDKTRISFSACNTRAI